MIATFNMVDNNITEVNGKSQFKKLYVSEKTENQLTNFVVNDLETYNTDSARPYNIAFYRLSKIAGEYIVI